MPGRKQRNRPVNYDKRRSKRRTRIEIMSVGLRIGDTWQPKVFRSAIALAATVVYWLWTLNLEGEID